MIAAAYLAGSIPAGFLIVRALHGIDIRQHGSGNVGTANVFRTTGLATAVLVLLMDVAKGAGPVLAARLLGLEPVGLALSGLAAVVGHSYSLFLGFRGGKSVATTAGALLMMDPLSLAGGLIVYAIVTVVSRYASVGSLSGAAGAVLLLLLRRPSPWYMVFGLAAFALIVWRHRSNIMRLARRCEPRLSLPSRRERE